MTLAIMNRPPRLVGVRATSGRRPVSLTVPRGTLGILADLGLFFSLSLVLTGWGPWGIAAGIALGMLSLAFFIGLVLRGVGIMAAPVAAPAPEREEAELERAA